MGDKMVNQILDKEVKESIERKGYKEMNSWNENGTDVTLFLKGGNILKIELTEDADEEILKELRGDIKIGSIIEDK